MNPRLFDVYLAIDWSARSKPSPARPFRDSVWVGEYVVHDSEPAETHDWYFRTRHACEFFLRERLIQHGAKGRRVFVGFDFAFGYPAGSAAAFGLDGGAPPWRVLWEELAERIEDGPDNKNNRFQVAAALNTRCGAIATGPFWGCPVNIVSPSLRSNKQEFAYPYSASAGLILAEKRITEGRQRGVQPTWKLFGNGSVGGQTLLGIPVVHRLRHLPELSDFSRIVPFETGFTRTPTPERGPWITYVEIYSGVVNDWLEDGMIRDRAQVRAYVHWLARLEATNDLARLFDRPDGLTEAQAEAILREEGWILGVK
ncbi:MAG: hypothetical protein IPK19_39335 [Chloroflexi bacterium]|nr:hypothetical protein [Chloroflexota bacterium]